MQVTNALSIDLVGWYHPELVREQVGRFPSPQIIEATQPILHLLDRYETKVSFLILGEVVDGHTEPMKACGKEKKDDHPSRCDLWGFLSVV